MFNLIAFKIINLLFAKTSFSTENIINNCNTFRYRLELMFICTKNVSKGFL